MAARHASTVTLMGRTTMIYLQEMDTWKVFGIIDLANLQQLCKSDLVREIVHRQKE